MQPSVAMTSGLVARTTTGVISEFQTTWSANFTNVFSTVTPFMPNDANVTNASTIDPQLGGCIAYLPAASPMRGAGPDGTNIGADIRVQYQDGIATTTPYWRSDGTFAGCGAVIPGVNDDPATSCIGVHQRLHVGAAGCAWP
jgi:hypothetical protein